jgi:hypothetical protein
MTKDLIKMEMRDIETREIPDETVQEIIGIGEDVPHWAKVTEGGFLIFEKTIPELEGIICELYNYLVEWDGKKPHKIPTVPSDSQIPEGYERRVDMKVMIGDQLVGISLAKSSIKYHLAPYLKYLSNHGYKPNDVVTKFRIKQVSNVHGSFPVTTFSMVGLIKSPEEIVSNSPYQKNPEAKPSVSSALPSEWQ